MMTTEGLSPWLAPGAALCQGLRTLGEGEGRKEGTHCQGFQFLQGNRDLLLLNSSHLLSHCLDSCALVVFAQITAAVALVPGFVPLLADKAFPLTLYEFCSQPEAPSLC